jgi:hypothetical protein
MDQLTCITNQALCVCETHIGGCCAVTLVVGNDLNTIILPHTHTTAQNRTAGQGTLSRVMRVPCTFQTKQRYSGKLVMMIATIPAAEQPTAAADTRRFHGASLVSSKEGTLQDGTLSCKPN